MTYFKFLFFYTINIFANKTNNLENNKYNILLIEDFFLEKESILKIKTAYELFTKKEKEMKDFYEDLELVIYIFYIIKNNFSEDILPQIFEKIEAPKEFTQEESLLFKMLVKINSLCEIIYKNIKFYEFYEKNENYEDNHIYYNSLIVEGGYKKNPPSINIFDNIKTNIFHSDLKKIEKKYELSSLKVFYKKTNKILENKIDKKNKTFQIILHTSNILPVIHYQIDLFTFDRTIDANKSLRLLNENPSMNMELFKKYLIANKIKYEYTDVNITSEQLTFEMKNFLNNKNINEKFLIENKVFFIKSKKYSRIPLKNFEFTQEENYFKLKKILLEYMKNYKEFIKFIKTEYNK